MFRSKEFIHLLMVFLLVTFIILPITFLGIPRANDLQQHFQFALTFYDSILSGNLLPSWSAHENYGFGGIGIRFYPPLSHYVLVFMRILTGNWYEAAWLSILLWMYIGCIGVYLLAREWLTPINSAWAGAVFSITPYHLAQIYQIFIYSEFAATAILPFCFLFLTKICRRGNAGDIVLFSFSFALLILTHIPTTIIGTVSLGIYAVLISDWRKWWETFVKLAISFGLGFAATAFHWLKIVTEMSLVNHVKENYASGHYDYKGNLFPLFFNAPVSSYFTKLQWLMDIEVILTIFLLLPLTLHWLLKRKNTDIENNEKKLIRAVFITALFAFLMTTSLSTIIWQTLPFLNRIQFPWRWLSVVSLLGAVCFITGAMQLIRFKQLHTKVVKYVLIVIVFGLMLFNLTQLILPMASHPRAEFEAKLSNLLHEESYPFWWTVWAKHSAFNQREKVFADSRDLKINLWQAEERNFEVTKGKPTTARIATFYYPHWKAKINGQSTEIKMAEDGTMLIALPPEAATVRIWFQEPIWIRLAFYLSALTWLGFVGICIVQILRNWKSSEIGEYEHSY